MFVRVLVFTLIQHLSLQVVISYFKECFGIALGGPSAIPVTSHRSPSYCSLCCKVVLSGPLLEMH
jgi:hypothetical protein